MKVGYARVSATDQNLDRQLVALAGAHCDEIVEETASGVKARIRLTALLGRLTAGDTLVVVSLDRLGRRAGELVRLLDDQQQRGVKVEILDMPFLDYATPFGKLLAQVIAAFAEMERNVDRARQRGGIDAAKAAGRHLGRPPKLTGEQRRAAEEMRLEGKPDAYIAGVFRVHIRTLVKAIGKRPKEADDAQLDLVEALGSESAQESR